MTTPKARGLAAYNDALRMDDADLVIAVCELLGAKLAAYIAGATSTRLVSEWGDGAASIRDSADRQRLILAYRAATTITERGSFRVAQAWFQGTNPLFDDRAPLASIFRRGLLPA